MKTFWIKVPITGYLLYNVEAEYRSEAIDMVKENQISWSTYKIMPSLDEEQWNICQYNG